MLDLLLESALRSLALGVAVWLGLALLRVRNPRTQMTAWTVVLPLVGMPTFRTPVFLWKILTISPMSLRRKGSPPVGRRNIRLPLPMLVVTLSISSSDSSCLR